MNRVKLIPGGNKKERQPKPFPGPRQEQFLLVGQFSLDKPNEPQAPVKVVNTGQVIDALPPNLTCTLEDEYGHPVEVNIPIGRFSDINIHGIRKNCGLLQEQRWQMEAVEKLKMAMLKNEKFRKFLRGIIEHPEDRKQMLQSLKKLLLFLSENRETAPLLQ